MGLEEKMRSKEIEGATYDVTPLAFGLGRQVLVRLMRIITPFMATMFAADDKAAALGRALMMALPETAEDDLKYFESQFAKGTMVKLANGTILALAKDEIREIHFSANYEAYFDWLIFAVEVNYGNFFSASLRKMREKGAAKMATMSA